jgi:hypothetical protein
VIGSIDVEFSVAVRAGAAETPVARFTHHFDESPDGHAVRLDADAMGAAVRAAEGDLLVLRFTATGGDALSFYTPNGDGHFSNGRIPSIRLPQ